MPDAVEKNALEVLYKLNGCGFEAFWVGGCVRNRLMSVDVTDYDITTNALPQQVKSVFDGYETIETGIKHGTVTVIFNGTPFEITTYRSESTYTDSRHPDKVEFVSTLEEDLSRRDFTMNAIAYSPFHGVIDPFGGEMDIKNQIIRTVGDPSKRFSEDALRILRGLRFSSTLGFNVDEETEKAIFDLSDTISLVSSERIYTELKKLLLGKNAYDVLNKYKTVFSKLIPVSNDFSKISVLPLDVPTRFFCLCGDNVNDALNRLRADNETKRKCKLLKNSIPIPQDYIRQKQYIAALGREDAEYVAVYRNIVYNEDIADFMKHIKDAPCLSIRELNINGDDLMSLGFNGPKIKQCLDYLLNEVICDRLKNEYNILVEHVKNIDIL